MSGRFRLLLPAMLVVLCTRRRPLRRLRLLRRVRAARAAARRLALLRDPPPPDPSRAGRPSPFPWWQG